MLKLQKEHAAKLKDPVNENCQLKILMHLVYHQKMNTCHLLHQLFPKIARVKKISWLGKYESSQWVKCSTKQIVKYFLFRLQNLPYLFWGSAEKRSLLSQPWRTVHRSLWTLVKQQEQQNVCFSFTGIHLFNVS